MFVENVGHISIEIGETITYLPAFMKWYGHFLDDAMIPDMRTYYVKTGSPIAVFQGKFSQILSYQFHTKTTRHVEIRSFPNSVDNKFIAWYINKHKSLVYICVKLLEGGHEVGFVTNVQNITYVSKDFSL